MSIEATITLSPEDSAIKINSCHQRGGEAMIDSLKHYAEAGMHLKKARNTVENFENWVRENLTFSKKTAYQYIKLADKVEGGLNLDSGEFTSIRQCLGIDHDGEKSTYAEKRHDIESGASKKLTEVFSVDLHPGMILYIPRWLYHKCEPREKRISLSFAMMDVVKAREPRINFDL